MRRRMLASVGGKPLPYDAEVEWIESTGLEYIDTGIVPSSANDSFYVDFSISSFVGESRIASCYSAGYGVDFYVSPYGYGFVDIYDGASWLSKKFPTIYGKNELSVEFFNGAYMNGGSAILHPDFSRLNRSLVLNAMHNTVNPHRFGANIRYYGFRYLRNKNTELIMDLIPVKILNEGAMYDRVSGKLFRNAGTGAFLIGPDKA